MANVTLTIPDTLMSALAERGISDEASLNRFAVAAMTACVDHNAPLLDVDTSPLSDEDLADLDRAFADIRAGLTLATFSAPVVK